MNRFNRLRPSPAMAVALVALFVALGGVGYAAVTIGSSQIKNNSVASKDIRNRTIRGKDVKRNALSGRQIKEGSLGAVPNATNAANAATANAASNSSALGGKSLNDVVTWAAVLDTSQDEAGATILRSSVAGVAVEEEQGSFHLGHYTLTFPRSVAGCAASATLGVVDGFEDITNGSPATGEIAVGPGDPPNDTKLLVSTSFEETPEDRSFYVVVNC